MYNSNLPSLSELPSSKQLQRSTIIAAVSALVLLITVILPSEYGIDPTGVGRVLRLTEMGEIKTQLAAEAAADASVGAQADGASASPSPTQAPVVAVSRGATVAASPMPVPTQATWKDEERFTLPPGQGIEIKLVMKEGTKAEYAWVANGGVVNYDTHGDGGGKSISYEKGRGVQKNEGVLTAAFTGNHGWFWRNRSQSNVEVVLRTRGDYSELKRDQ